MNDRGRGFAASAWALAASLAAAALTATACRKAMEGGKPVAESVADTLRIMDRNDDAHLRTYAEALRMRALRETEEAVALMHGKDTALADKALAVTLNLGSLAFQPLLDSLNPDRPEDCALELRQALDLQTADRQHLAAKLDKLMDEKVALKPPPQPANTEERIRPRRLCDEAYLALRKLLSLDESEDDQLVNERMFLDMSEADRDKEIQKVRKSKRFTPLAEYFPGE